MPIKFASSVTTRVSTVNLERQLLHCLLADKLNLQRTIGKHRSEFFTNQSRLFIYDCITTTFNDKRCTLSKEQFDFEIQKRFDSTKDKTRIDDFVSEFDLVKKTSVTEDIDAILQNLEDVQLANSTESLIREAYTKLESGNYVEAADMLKRKSIDLGSQRQEGKIYNLHKDSDEWFEEVKRRKEQPNLYAGIKTGFKEFDDKTGGLFPAELTVVFGLSGKGKSTFMKALSCNIRKSGKVVLHCGNEENSFQMRSKYMSADSGFEYSPFKKGTYHDDDYINLKKYSESQREEKGEIYIYEFPQQTDATCIERAYRQLEMQGIHVDAIVVDYLDLMKPCHTAYSENDEGGKVTSDLKQVAINCNCPVVTATQAGIQSEKQEKKDNPFLNQSDVFGTKRKVHSANVLIGIVNKTATAQAQDLTPEQRRIHHLVLCVPKNRDGAAFVFRQVMDTWTGRFGEDDGTSDNEALLRSIASQALRMCDDTLLPGQMVTEITMNEVNEAKKSKQRAEIEAIKAKLAEEANSDSDPFFDGAPGGDEFVEPQPEPEQKEDPLFGGVESSSEELGQPEAAVTIREEKTVVEHVEQQTSGPEKKPEPSSGKNSLDNWKSALEAEPVTPADNPEPYCGSEGKESTKATVETKTEGPARQDEKTVEAEPVRTSDSIPHKKSFAEILAEKNRAKKEALKRA